ncbi:MAG: HAD family phosphatase [Chloroflexi bacterium]|nr:HAD family phosphatase [Chloroflexota bacterium]
MNADSRIKAVIFDMDGTLADTERLKAMAYADCLAELLGLDGPDPRVLPLYTRYVGNTDRALCEAMVDRFGLAESLAKHVQRLGVREAWEALHQIRLEYYRDTYGQPNVIAENQITHNVELLKHFKSTGRTVAVATSSMTDEASRVLKAIGVFDLLETLVGRDQVTNAKPHPEIYLHTAELLQRAPEACLVIEDSPLGAASATAANMPCLVVPNAFTEKVLRERDPVANQWVIQDPVGLIAEAEEIISGL